ncbi:hypothetical protein TNCV_3831851 [Trichonephila clavipes]|nr:hypothetical protein TNCV_3831851 [Trichonephila clavipes]
MDDICYPSLAIVQQCIKYFLVSNYRLAVDSLRDGYVPPPAREGLLCFEGEGRCLCNGTDKEEGSSFVLDTELKLVPRKDRF